MFFIRFTATVNDTFEGVNNFFEIFVDGDLR